ncbi:MAG: putative rane protein [Modestobacter sp.]|jgi:integral membrane protein|nr:putative rane protein [Modestobacter sp.]
MPAVLTDPRTVARAFRAVAIAEAVSWLLLLAGMFVKWVLKTSELGVQLAGPVHGAVFMVYVVISLLAWRVLRWSPGTALLALIASVPPLCTVWFERWAQRTGRLPVGEAAATVAG